ncbi:MAG: ribulose-phosphate 3-epimerase [Armatimonadota bacterium]
MTNSPVYQQLRALAPTISVGVLTADVMKLGEELAALDSTGVGLLHFDVMDGCFCPSMTFGPSFIKGVRTSLLKDVHLLVVDPLSKIADYVAAGADILTVHLESEPAHIHRAFQTLAKMTNANDPERGIARGVAINPGTPVEAVKPLLDDIEMITLLAINPGWGGQQFIPSTTERVAETRRLIGERDILLCIDGGITRNNIAEIAGLGADIVVTGSAVFDGKAPGDNVRLMLNTLRGQA